MLQLDSSSLTSLCSSQSAPLDKNGKGDMTEATALAAEQGYHQRSPSMMIVVPLCDGEQTLVCDDLNVSYFDFFHEDYARNDATKGNESGSSCLVNDNSINEELSASFESPRSVVPGSSVGVGLEAATNLGVPLSLSSSSHTSIKKRALADLEWMPSAGSSSSGSTITRRLSSQSRRRNRNRALSATDFEETILPHLPLVEKEDPFSFGDENTHPLGASRPNNEGLMSRLGEC